ncbi:MAG TPA: ABC transporter permease subunit [Pyrinomonadaceae bacterium]|jgi:oligopeptide transport system permease protein|nr:ABC transporter permease subunit [Pyrinomonadaceae bacterium]
MLKFIFKRLLIIIPTALVVVTITWGLIRLAPGNFYSGEKKLPAAVEANIRAKYGLDKPWYQQYLMFLGRFVRGDFGDSLKYPGQTVNEIILRHFPYSAILGLLAYALALATGFSLGLISAAAQNTRADYLSMSAALVGLSVPNFVLAPIMVLLGAFWFYLLPPARWGGAANLILPVISLSAIYAAYIARLTRAGFIETLKSDFVRTARAKGLPEWQVMLRHSIWGAVVPIVSFTGPALANLLAGTVVVEKIFALPGLGDIFIKSILNRDEPLILGIVAFFSVLIMVLNLIVDIAYAWLDPRIRFETE